jgi:hypothetical protein
MTRLSRLSLAGSLVSVTLLALGCGFTSSGKAGSDGGGATGGSIGAGGASGTGQGGSPGSGGATGTGGSVATTGTGGSSGTTGCIPNGPQCNNCIDDDGDGLIDAADPECIGPLDNDEGTFATGIPGDNVDACKQDCFFDGNSGQGDDGCDWNLKCDPADPGSHLPKACPYDPNFHNCSTSQSQQCLTNCRTITPNGCDCFGCCQIPGAPHPIYLAPTCTAAAFNDPTKCPACTQVTSCINTCDHCEICVGKPTLPPDCSVGTTGAGGSSGSGGASGTGGAGGSGPSCPDGAAYCGPGGVDPLSCPPNTYCITGCCIPGVG